MHTWSISSRVRFVEMLFPLSPFQHFFVPTPLGSNSSRCTTLLGATTSQFQHLSVPTRPCFITGRFQIFSASMGLLSSPSSRSHIFSIRYSLPPPTWRRSLLWINAVLHLHSTCCFTLHTRRTDGQTDSKREAGEGRTAAIYTLLSVNCPSLPAWRIPALL